ncbi:hypothetical protein [Georgenia sp. 311]|uniref:hypothetical protein n=1 Tax=Georgenia sp. 311 TaxID=2585134 RepID=UPI00159B8DA2|nr:hypothetical protein [Georgenia sp. 311]
MERLSGEARDRVRASSLTLVGVLTLVLVAAGIYAGLTGGQPVGVAPSEVLAVSADGRTATVAVEVGGCERLQGVDVEAGADVVVLIARVVQDEPGTDGACEDVARLARRTVVLDEPLAGRALRTATP